MSFEHDDARMRVPRGLALRLAEIAKKRNISGRFAWGILARKVLLDFLEEEEAEASA